MRKLTPVTCEGCKRESPEIENCRIRVYQYKLFNKKCPREEEEAK